MRCNWELIIILNAGGVGDTVIKTVIKTVIETVIKTVIKIEISPRVKAARHVYLLPVASSPQRSCFPAY